MPKQIFCFCCGTPRWVQPSRVKLNNFCSPRCVAKWQSKKYVGRRPWNKGKTGMYSLQTLRRLAESKRAPFKTADAMELYRQGLSLPEVGRALKCSQSAVRRRLQPTGILRGKGEQSRGRPKSAQTKLRMVSAQRKRFANPVEREKLRGSGNPFWGRKHNPDSLNRMKQRLSLMFSGSGNPQWIDGRSQKGYTRGFTPHLKKQILERDSHCCQICGRVSERKGQLVVHHIDKQKKNNAIENLLVLCRSCHMGTIHCWEYSQRVNRAKASKLAGLSTS